VRKKDPERVRNILAASCATLVLVLAGCSGDEDGADDPADPADEDGGPMGDGGSSNGGSGGSGNGGAPPLGGAPGGGAGPTVYPNAPATSCVGEGCPLGECHATSPDTRCDAIYTAPLDESFSFCKPDYTGSYCVFIGEDGTAVGARNASAFIVTCQAGEESIVACTRRGCRKPPAGPYECS